MPLRPKYHWPSYPSPPFKVDSPSVEQFSKSMLSVFLFATAKVASATAMIIFHLILHPAVLIYDF